MMMELLVWFRVSLLRRIRVYDWCRILGSVHVQQ